MADTPPPIIIKKIKKGGGGHHGGAWKVAYADFVTAMMAFFLLLWLLSSTTKEQREGIADYFTPTTGLKDAKGIGFQGGATPNEKGSSKSTLTQPGIVVGQLPQGPVARDPIKKIDDEQKDDSQGQPIDSPMADPTQAFDKQQNTGDKGSKDADSEEFKRVEEQIMNAVEQSPELKQMKNNIIITHTPEGLKIDMVDDQNRPMFTPGGSTMTDTGRAVLKVVSDVVAKTDNRISLAGHTDGSTFVTKDGYSNWELSSDRANASRRYLTETGIDVARISKVTGMADRDLLIPNEPNSSRNRRVSLTLLRDSHVKSVKTVPTARGLLTVPSVDTKQISGEAPADAGAEGDASKNP